MRSSLLLLRCGGGCLDTESSRKLRESFAKACFETLLQFSFVIRSTAASSQDDGAITHLAILSLLDRCKSVLVKFVADERLSGKCPLPRFTDFRFLLLYIMSANISFSVPIFSHLAVVSY